MEQTEGWKEGIVSSERLCVFLALGIIPKRPVGSVRALVRSFARLLVARTKIRGPTRLRRVALSQLLPTAVSPRHTRLGKLDLREFQAERGQFLDGSRFSLSFVTGNDFIDEICFHTACILGCGRN